MLLLLRQNTNDYQEEFEQTIGALGRIGRELAAIKKAMVSIEPDHAGIERGLAEAERGEGEDVETVLARFQNRGEL